MDLAAPRLNSPRSKETCVSTEAISWRAASFAALYSIGILNGFAVDVVEAVRSQPFWSAVGSTFGISVVSVAAVACGLTLVLRSADREIGRTEIALAAFLVLLLLVPHRATSWAAITVLALYQLVRSRSTGVERAGAAIFLALAASEFWARIMLQALGNVLLSWDAALVSGVLAQFMAGEVVRSGNLIALPNGTSIALIVGCDSLTTITYGILCWLVIAKGMRPVWTRFDLAAVAAVVALVVVFNTVRVALMATDPQNYELVHGAIGADVFNIVLLALSGAIALWTVYKTPDPLGSSPPAARDL